MRLHSSLILLLASCAAGFVHAENWTPTNTLLDAVRRIESANGRYVVGDGGQSLGDYQLSEAAWVDVSAWRRARDLPVWNYDEHVWNRKASRAYAADYLKILHHRLEKRLHREPSPTEVYAAYNMGMSSFARRQFRVANSGSITAGKCRQIRQLTRGE